MLFKEEYILKGRREGAWEEIGRYDRKVSWKDVKAEFGDLCADYEMIRLDNSKGKAQWVKSCHSRQSLETLTKQTYQMQSFMTALQSMLASQVQAYSQLFELIRKYKEESEKEKPTFEDLVAQILWYESMKEKLREWLGVSGGSGGDVLGSFLSGLLKTVAERVVQSQLNVAPLNPSLKAEPGEEVKKKVQEVVSEADKRVMEFFEKCAVCREEEKK